MNVAQIVEELREAIESPGMRWTASAPPEEAPEAKHFVGNGEGWQVHLFVYGDVVDGSALNMGRCTAVHLTPAMASKARELALKAVA